MKYKIISFICILLITCSLFSLIYIHLLQPYISEKTTDSYREIYYSTDSSPLPSADTDGKRSTESEETTISRDYISEDARDIPAKFKALKEQNNDICGWLHIPGTNIDYPVVSTNKEQTDYYLTHNIDGAEDKNGTLFLDYRTELTKEVKSLVINGHNMKSTGLMFHELTSYKKLDFYKQNPTFTFDTIYGDGTWKIFAVFKTNNNENHGERFNYFRDEFVSDAEFLDYIYELELRSIYHCPVDLNETDSLLLLSTCSYEMDDMRFVVAARKVREGEDIAVDTSLAYAKKAVLYPDAWYEQYGGTKPVATSFTEAYAAGEIIWYDGNIGE